MTAFRDVHGPWHRSTRNPTWAAFVRFASRTEEGRRALACWRRARQRVAWPSCKDRALAGLLREHARSRVLVFTTDNAVAYAIARRHLVAPLTCDIGKAERARLLARFADGSLHALVSARVLNEGVDVPAADVAIVTGGSGGDREYVQRVGRVLRPDGGKRALVAELVVRGTHEVRQQERNRSRLAAR
jgi:superfamily II DNA or RNA helicase